MERECCNNVPDYEKVVSRSISSVMTPLQRSLSKLEAKREVQKCAAQFVDKSAEEDDGTDGKLTLVEDEVKEKGLGEIEGDEHFDPD